MDSQKAYKYFDGTSDVRKFVTKTELEAALKNHADEKKAQYMASKLVGHAMDVYLRMSDEDKKDPEKLKAELLKEFERGQLNREEAIAELDSRKRLPNEAAETYAYKVIELIKLAYPSFGDPVRASLAKDFFVKGLSNELQLALKSGANYSTMDVKAVTTEAVRLELAGVGVKKPCTEASIEAGDDMVDKIAEKVIQRLGGVTVSSAEDRASDGQINSATAVPPQRRGPRGNRNRGRARGRGTQSNQTRACRSCQNTDHIVKDCPTRFCQACGGRGHDQFNSTCPNYQL